MCSGDTGSPSTVRASWSIILAAICRKGEPAITDSRSNPTITASLINNGLLGTPLTINDPWPQVR
jgi:hypothetical protein